MKVMLNDKDVSLESLVSGYEGRDLTEIGVHLPNMSSYNHNYYKLPNGTVVLLQNDDDGFNQVSVKMPNGELKYVGAQYDHDGRFMVGEFY